MVCPPSLFLWMSFVRAIWFLTNEQMKVDIIHSVSNYHKGKHQICVSFTLKAKHWTENTAEATDYSDFQTAVLKHQSKKKSKMSSR